MTDASLLELWEVARSGQSMGSTPVSWDRMPTYNTTRWSARGLIVSLPSYLRLTFSLLQRRLRQPSTTETSYATPKQWEETESSSYSGSAALLWHQGCTTHCPMDWAFMLVPC